MASVSLPGPAGALGARPAGRARTGHGGWWFPPTALGRVAALRLLAYAFIPVDVLVTTAWVGQHGDVPGVLYRPVMAARLLHLPTPTRDGVDLLKLALLVAAATAAVAVLTRATTLVRLAGAAVFGLYGWWMLVAMSYGKVDHDRFAFLVLLGVLPTVGAARLGERRRSLEAGWAVRMTEVAVVATYFFAVEQAPLRRLELGDGCHAHPGRPAPRDRPGAVDARSPGRPARVPVGPAPARARRRSCSSCAGTASGAALIGALIGFHVMTYLAIRIIFLPHVVAPWPSSARAAWPARRGAADRNLARGRQRRRGRPRPPRPSGRRGWSPRRRTAATRPGATPSASGCGR